MRLDHLFFGYMALAGAAAGVILVARPDAGDLAFKPYFWMLIAVAAFDIISYMRGRGVPGSMLGMDGRLLGFVIGVVLMVVIPSLAGSPAKFF